MCTRNKENVGSIVKKITKRKLLKELTIAEIITIAIAIATLIATFDYMFDMALNSFTSPWIGEVTNLNEKYNVTLMNTLGMVFDISLYVFVGANIFRFILIKRKYKIEMLISTLLTMMFMYLYVNLKANWASLIILLIAFILYIHSHKIKGEYDEINNSNNIENISNEDSQCI